MTSEARIFGLAWYDLDQWTALAQIVADRESLDATFGAWEAGAEAALQLIRAQGQIALRIPVDVAKLDLWCRNRGLPNTSASRAEYAAQLLHEMAK